MFVYVYAVFYSPSLFLSPSPPSTSMRLDPSISIFSHEKPTRKAKIKQRQATEMIRGRCWFEFDWFCCGGIVNKCLFSHNLNCLYKYLKITTYMHLRRNWWNIEYGIWNIKHEYIHWVAHNNHHRHHHHRHIHLPKYLLNNKKHIPLLFETEKFVSFLFRLWWWTKKWARIPIKSKKWKTFLHNFFQSFGHLVHYVLYVVNGGNGGAHCKSQSDIYMSSIPFLLSTKR